jgi:hypothetical protein
MLGTQRTTKSKFRGQNQRIQRMTTIRQDGSRMAKVSQRATSNCRTQLWVSQQLLDTRLKWLHLLHRISFAKAKDYGGMAIDSVVPNGKSQERVTVAIDCSQLRSKPQLLHQPLHRLALPLQFFQ